MALFGEAYFHLKRIKLDEEQIEQVGSDVSYIAYTIALKKFPSDCLIEVRISDGSVKGWVSIAGALAILGGVSDYKGAKEGISEMVKDAKWVAGVINEQVSKIQIVQGATVYRTERRTKTPGRIKRLIEKREWLERNRASMSGPMIDQVQFDLEKLLQQILMEIDPDDRLVLRRILGQEHPAIPMPSHSKSALPVFRHEQDQLFIDDDVDLHSPNPDYFNRFRLSDGPSKDTKQLEIPNRGQLR